MRLFPPPLEIGEDEGFTPEKDIFGRAAIGEGLTNLVDSVSDPTVIAVDGQWGSGKSTFLRMWAGELRKQRFPVVYLDAFENDYFDDAFLAIASEIIALAVEKKKEDTVAGKRLVSTAITAGKVLLRSSLKLGVKAATVGALGAADLDEIAADFAGEASSLVDKHLGELLTRQKQQKDAIQGFRDALSELPKALLDEPVSADDAEKAMASKPLILIIDELDRCRPTFALEILERIKHFFSVENVHFVLGVHLGQLQNSVALAYGPNIDAKTYLQKFILLTLNLVDRQRFPHERTAKRFIEYLQKAMEFKAEDRDLVGCATELTQHVADHRNLSLRSIERVMTNLSVALAFTPANVLRAPPIVAGLCILKVTEPELFAAAKRGQLRYTEARDSLLLELPHGDEGLRDWYARWWKFCTGEPFEGEEEFGRGLWQYNIEPTEIIAHTANAVIDRLRPEG